MLLLLVRLLFLLELYPKYLYTSSTSTDFKFYGKYLTGGGRRVVSAGTYPVAVLSCDAIPSFLTSE